MRLRSDTELRLAWEKADCDGARMAVRDEWREVWARKVRGEITDRSALDRFDKLTTECALDFGVSVKNRETTKAEFNRRVFGVWVESECYCDVAGEGKRFRAFAEKLFNAASENGLLVTQDEYPEARERPDKLRVVTGSLGIAARWLVRVTFWYGPPKEWR